MNSRTPQMVRTLTLELSPTAPWAPTPAPSWHPQHLLGSTSAAPTCSPLFFTSVVLSATWPRFHTPLSSPLANHPSWAPPRATVIHATSFLSSPPPSVPRGEGGGRDLLERGGGGGEGSRGEGSPPPCRNVPSPQGTENLLGNEPLSTWKCHLVGSKQSQFIIAGQFRVPSSNQDTTNTTKRDIHHLMPTHSDHGQSELDSPVLEPPSVVEVELEPDDDEESESLPEWETSDKCCHWHTQKQCGTCLLCLIVCFLSLPASDPIFKPKIKQCVDYVFAFCAW